MNNFTFNLSPMCHTAKMSTFIILLTLAETRLIVHFKPCCFLCSLFFWNQ